VHPFYQKADIVLNLTRIDLANETFGLTVIEAMAYGLPVIVPTIGGIAELVTDGENGYKIDSRNIAELSEKLNQMLQPELYKKMSTVQKKMIHQFEEKNFIHQNLLFITK
jgi:glycosyltransferase involved in cell wall biosynthesis